MNDDPAFPICTTYNYSDGRLTAIEDAAGRREVALDPTARPPPSSAMAHDLERRIFVVTGPDGKTDVYRDNPTRYLSVAPDPETGEMKPIIKHGKPTYFWLCREERDIH
jgi:hypothetical protein